MPLLKGNSQKTISLNIAELMHGKMGKARAKGLKTMMMKGMSKKTALRKQSVAIAFAKAKKSKKYA